MFGFDIMHTFLYHTWSEKVSSDEMWHPGPQASGLGSTRSDIIRDGPLTPTALHGVGPLINLVQQQRVAFLTNSRGFGNDAGSPMIITTKHHRPAVVYQPGNQVWLDRSKFANLRPSKKLDDLNIGPFPIKEKVGLSLYRLELPLAYSQVHPTMHESHLRPYVEPVVEHQKPPPPPKDL